ncbi:hypothetical protein [Paenarthrobacter sp. NPDC090522]|uniref:hypothetical protein n=1 Tax=Paenarthrobacter sp. NPDC090522 TaxID=3364383 RepID=UPI003812A32C
MNRRTFGFLAKAIGITTAEYGQFFGVSAEEITAEKAVTEEAERALLAWQETHASHVEYALLCFRLWHRQDLLEELMEDFANVTDLSNLHEVTERAQERYGMHFMDELTRLTTTIEIVMPDQEYFATLAAKGLVTAPSYGMHVSAFQHAILRAHREGLRIEILDSTGKP